MGILQRFGDIMSANINALLDKAEDPSKMVDQYLRNLESDLGKVKAETASVIAEEKKSKRELDECASDIAKMQSYAEKAVLAGNDEDARQFLARKAELVTQQGNLQQIHTAAAANADKMRQMHDKLVKDIASLNQRRDAIKAKVSVAKAQERVNKIGSSMDGVSRNLSAFDKLEAKADKMLDEADAMAELNQIATTDTVEDLVNKYDVDTQAVDDELEALKQKLGK